MATLIIQLLTNFRNSGFIQEAPAIVGCRTFSELVQVAAAHAER